MHLSAVLQFCRSAQLAENKFCVQSIMSLRNLFSFVNFPEMYLLCPHPNDTNIELTHALLSGLCSAITAHSDTCRDTTKIVYPSGWSARCVKKVLEIYPPHALTSARGQLLLDVLVDLLMMHLITYYKAVIDKAVELRTNLDRVLVLCLRDPSSRRLNCLLQGLPQPCPAAVLSHPLHTVYETVQDRSDKIIKLLEAKVADVSEQKHALPILFRACQDHDFETACTLVDCGANIFMPLQHEAEVVTLFDILCMDTAAPASKSALAKLIELTLDMYSDSLTNEAIRRAMNRVAALTH